MKVARLFLLFSAFVAGAYFLVFRAPSPSRAQSQSSGGGRVTHAAPRWLRARLTSLITISPTDGFPRFI